MIKQLQATRTCSVCGQKKPLVAFLELAGDKGHTYGDICATCRGAGLGRKKPGEEGAGETDDTTRLQIDNKTKVQQEQDKKDRILPPPEEGVVQDSLGNPLIKVKEGSLRHERMVSFVHNDIAYELSETGELVKKSDEPTSVK